jgi:hypothetical protein
MACDKPNLEARQPMRNIAATLILLGATNIVLADCGASADICAGNSPWARATTATVRAQFEPSADFAAWEFTFSGDNDLLLIVDTHQGKESTQGSILLVSGRAMLTKGLSLEQGYEIDALDAPVLMYQLVVGLLAQAIPDGPQKLVKSHKVHVSETKRGIQTATMSASGRYPAPWTVDGSVDQRGPSSFGYSLTFTYPTEDKTGRATIVLKGQWSNAVGPGLTDSMNIEGWSLHTIGPFSMKQEGSTVLDYGAQAKPLTVRTLGDLREALAKNEASSRR